MTVDSNFLNAVHSFKMDLIPALERTVQGKVKPRMFYLLFRTDISIATFCANMRNTYIVLTKCSLAAIMASQPINPKTNAPYRPTHLPPPTTLPLRHCSHNEDSSPIDEIECLLSLFSPSAESKKNKEHYILATADPADPEKVAAKTTGDGKAKRRAELDAEEAVRRARALRSSARDIPGVPIVYVKRSVMVLEPMSRPSEGVRDGYEQGKFRVGLDADSALGKRKRGENENADGGAEKKDGKKKKSGKARGPNPLSMKKPKKREDQNAASEKKKPVRKDEGPKDAGNAETAGDVPEAKEGDSNTPKPKRRRRHNKAKGEGGDDAGGEPSNGAETTAPTDSME